MMPAESARRPLVMLTAGEVSGDLHGGALAAALFKLAPEARLFGMGGERMAAAGVELLARLAREGGDSPVAVRQGAVLATSFQPDHFQKLGYSLLSLFLAHPIHASVDV